jgi:glycosyltransferase involved in cell wall biosynthesis
MPFTPLRMEKGIAPDKKDLSLSVILPVYNEEEAIAETLSSVVRECEGLGIPYEVIVVDDGSSDSTPEKVRNFAVRLIRHPYNIGNGAAIKRGIRAARNDVIIFLDADGQHDAKDFRQFIELIRHYDMVVGARDKESDTEKHRDFANSIYNFLASYISGRRVLDLTSGYRAIRRPIADQLVYLLPNTFSYPSTLTLSMHRAGYSIAYTPVQVRRRKGKSKISLLRDGFRFLVIILRLAVFFAPLKIFLPISILLAIAGVVLYFERYLATGAFSPGAILLMLGALIIFVLSMLSEQISFLRYQNPGATQTDWKGK